jgi:hypothetical protein
MKPIDRTNSKNAPPTWWVLLRILVIVLMLIGVIWLVRNAT